MPPRPVEPSGRACTKIGELSLQLDKAEHGPGRGNKSLPSTGSLLRLRPLPTPASPPAPPSATKNSSARHGRGSHREPQARSKERYIN